MVHLDVIAMQLDRVFCADMIRKATTVKVTIGPGV